MNDNENETTDQDLNDGDGNSAGINRSDRHSTGSGDDRSVDQEQTRTIGSTDRASVLDDSIAQNGIESEIGNYEIVRELGQGGMGTVFLAHQRRPVQREVALKVIRTGMGSRDDIARFEVERQALAMMDHPNIATVFDAGTTDDGRPYFVMERVKGIPLTRYCDKKQMSIRDRLALMLPVCQAIQHAHQKGIIHRDLKPSNILVAEEDGRAVPKVIDFGLAKALDQTKKLTDKTLSTEIGRVVGTLRYMSPEQAQTDSIDIDTRTDIYSLGVILYELLTGSTPIDKASAKKELFLKVLETIRDSTPPRPSLFLSESSSDIRKISDDRKIDPKKLQQVLRGELDWIVLKSLEKERSRRYESASDLGMDLQRFLDDEPVQARPPSLGYRGKKLVKKYRWAVTAAALITISLVTGMITTTWQAVRATNATKLAESKTELANEKADESERRRQEAVKAKKRAERMEGLERSARQDTEAALVKAQQSAERVNNVLRLVVDSFRNPDPSRGNSVEMKARDVLNLALSKIEERLRDDVAAKGILLNAISASFVGLGEYDVAVANGDQAVKYLNEAFGKTDINSILAENTYITALLEAGHIDQAGKRVRANYENARQSLGATHRETLIAKANLGNYHLSKGESGTAIRLLEEEFEQVKKNMGLQSHDAIRSLNNLAAAHEHDGNAKKAIEYYEQAVDLAAKVFGERHTDSLTALNNLALAYTENGQPEKALKMITEVLRHKRKILGDDHPSTLIAITNLGRTLREMGQRDKALPLYEEALEKAGKVFGEHHAFFSSAHNNLAFAYEDAGRMTEAYQLYHKTIELRKRYMGEDHPRTIIAIDNLAITYDRRGRKKESIPLFAEALELHRKRYGRNDPRTHRSTENLAWKYSGVNEFAKAVKLMQLLYDFRSKKFGAEDPRTVDAASTLATFHLSNGDLDLAEDLHKSCLEIKTKLAGKDHDATRDSLRWLQVVQMIRKDYSGAESTIQRWIESVERKKATKSSEYGWALTCLAECYCGKKDFEKAEEMARKAVQLGATNVVEKARAQSIIGLCLAHQKKWDEAEPLLKQAVNHHRKVMPDMPDYLRPHALHSAERLIAFYQLWDKQAEVKKWAKELESIKAEIKTLSKSMLDNDSSKKITDRSYTN